MVNPPTLEGQRKFYEENIGKLLLKYSGGFVVYHGNLGDNYDYYETREDLMAVWPEPDDNRSLPFIVDIVEEQFRRRDESERAA